MNEHITKFIIKQTCATVCCVDEKGNPYCFSCFYVFNSDEGLLYFKSSANTHHASLISKNASIAGTILPDKLNVIAVRGIQFQGMILSKDHPSAQHASLQFYKKNPAAIAIPGEIWTIRIDHIKMTDSKLGFGKKISWNRVEESIQ